MLPRQSWSRGQLHVDPEALLRHVMAYQTDLLQPAANVQRIANGARAGRLHEAFFSGSHRRLFGDEGEGCGVQRATPSHIASTQAGTPHCGKLQAETTSLLSGCDTNGPPQRRVDSSRHYIDIPPRSPLASVCTALRLRQCLSIALCLFPSD